MSDDSLTIVIHCIKINTEDNPDAIKEAVMDAVNEVKPWNTSKCDLILDNVVINDHKYKAKESNFFDHVVKKLRKYWSMIGEADD